MKPEVILIFILAITTVIIMVLDGGSWRERWRSTHDLCETVETENSEIDMEKCRAKILVPKELKC